MRLPVLHAPQGLTRSGLDQQDSAIDLLKNYGVFVDVSRVLLADPVQFAGRRIHESALAALVAARSRCRILRQEGPYLLVRTPSRDNLYQRKHWTYELRDFRTKTTIWTRHFPEEPPSLAWTPDRKKVLMGWPVSSAAVYDELNAFPDLKNSAEKEDTFYELVDVKDGAVRSRLLVNTNKYSFRVKSAKVDGDWAAFEVNGHRVLIYCLATGKEQGHVFGHARRSRAWGGVYAVSIAYKKLSSDGKRLFVLTRNQTSYVLDLNSSLKQSSVAVKAATQ